MKNLYYLRCKFLEGKVDEKLQQNKISKYELPKHKK